MCSEETPVRLERRDGVGILTIDRPKTLNALSLERRHSLLAALVVHAGDAEHILLNHLALEQFPRLGLDVGCHVQTAGLTVEPP